MLTAAVVLLFLIVLPHMHMSEFRRFDAKPGVVRSLLGGVPDGPRSLESTYEAPVAMLRGIEADFWVQTPDARAKVGLPQAAAGFWTKMPQPAQHSLLALTSDHSNLQHGLGASLLKDELKGSEAWTFRGFQQGEDQQA